jgi:hypothetical protein
MVMPRAEPQTIQRLSQLQHTFVEYTRYASWSVHCNLSCKLVWCCPTGLDSDADAEGADADADAAAGRPQQRKQKSNHKQPPAVEDRCVSVLGFVCIPSRH